jgi:hypothetical protein
MFRQVGIGAAAVLTIGLLAAGCSEDGDTIIAGGGALLQNQDTTPFSGLTSNNLAPDGGGFSANGSNATAFVVTFNCDNAKSDGTYAGDDSAIVLFSLQNNRVYASYFTGGTFTPPVELEAADRDYGVNPGNLSGYICMPLNTANYQSTNQTPATEVNTVRQNNGNWVIIGDFVTRFALPGQVQNNASSLGKGVRRTIGSWVFLKGESGNSLSTSSAVGSITREFRYGFQRTADEIATSHTTGVLAPTIGGAATSPANNVMSYGVASDGIAGQASWTGSNTTPNTGTTAGPSSVANNTTLGNNYSVGEAVSNLTVVFSQIETTLSSDSDQLRRNALDGATSRGEGLFLRYRNFNLATMTWGTEARISTGIDINTGTGSTEAGSGVYSDFHTYNNTVFFRYMDASMRVNVGSTFTADTLNIQTQHNILAATRFTDQANGTATQSGTVDISTDSFCVTVANAAGSTGAHHITVPATSGTITLGSVENSSFFAYNGNASTQSIYGADEGLGDMTVFYSLADGTNQSNSPANTGSGPNSDAELAVVGIPTAGTLNAAALTTGFGTNPLRISGAHAVNGQTTTATTNNNLTDPIGTPSFAMNRTGEWIGVAFTRLNGITQNSAFQRNLYANIYQTFRIVSSTTQAGQTGGVAATMQNRVLAAGPSLIDSPSSGGLNAAAPNGTEIPVNAFAWQGKACYRGWQSNKDIMSLFFEQSDNTGDRVFGARLTVTIGGTSTAPAAPTLANASAVELAFANNVLGDAAFFTTTGGPGTTSFEFLNGNGRVTNSAHFQSCDSGLDNNGAGGSVYVAFTRVDDGTTTDSGSNDLGDVSIYATVFSGTAFETPVKIGTTADTNEAIGATAGAAPFNQAIATSNNIGLLSVDCLPNNTDITNKPSYPTTGDSTHIVTSMQDRDGSTLITASGASTPTVVSGNSSGLLVPMFRVLRATAATATPALNSVDTRMNPSVVNTATSPYSMPVRLAHEAGLTTNLQAFRTCQNGTTLHILFQINSQVWYQTTSGDTAEVLREASTQQVNPGLVSNFSSANVVGTFAGRCCQNGTGDDTGAIVNFTKADSAGTDNRFMVADAQF